VVLPPYTRRGKAAKRIKQKLSDAEISSGAYALQRRLETTLKRYAADTKDLERVDQQILVPVMEAQEKYTHGGITKRQYDRVVARAERELTAFMDLRNKDKKRSKKHRIGRGDNLATIVDKGMAAAILFLLTAIFFFDKTSITGYAVSAATGTSLAGYYSLLGFAALGMAVLYFAHQRN